MNKNATRIVNFDPAVTGDNIMTELKRDWKKQAIICSIPLKNKKKSIIGLKLLRAQIFFCILVAFSEITLDLIF